MLILVAISTACGYLQSENRHVVHAAVAEMVEGCLAGEYRDFGSLACWIVEAKENRGRVADVCIFSAMFQMARACKQPNALHVSYVC